MNTITLDIDTRKLENSAALIAAAETEDELGAVLRFHLATENLLSFYINERNKGELSKYAKEPNNFGGKLALAAAFGLPIPLARIAHQINVIRNKLAHEPQSSISDGDLSELVRNVNRLTEIDPEFAPVEKRYIELAAKNPGEKLSFGEHGNRVDFVLAAFSFYSAAPKHILIDIASRRLAQPTAE
ncbi:hypothetical protein D3C77_441940 [compost metagenome]